MSNARDRLLSMSGKRNYESVTVDLDGEPLVVWFRTVGGAERDAFEESILVERVTLVNGKPKKKRATNHDNIRAKIIALAACKDDGDPAPLFSEQDVIALGKVDARILDPLFEKASQMAGLSESDVKELAGN